MTDGESSALPDYLRDGPNDGEPLPRSEPPAHSRRPVGPIAALAIASAVVGSVVTLGFTRTSAHTTEPRAVAATTSTFAANPVVRVDEPATIDGWVIVVTRFRVVSAWNGSLAPSGRRWLVVDARLTNATDGTQTFTPDMIEARSLDATGDGAFVSAVTGEAWQPPPHSTLVAIFTFSVPEQARTFTLVVRREIETQKQRGDSVEIDLNCC